MLELQSWLPQAQELCPQVGQRRTTEHDCGPGKKLIVENKPEGFAAWCYRCSDKGWHPHPQPSLAERIARLRKQEAAESAAEATPAPPLPAEFNPSEWPLHARVWLYKAGFSNEHIIGTLGAYYCPPLDRVVLPVLRDGKVVYWQARGFDKDRPKYLNPPVDKPIAIYGSRGPLIVTEDLLSAARIGAIARGASILGTSLDDRGAQELANRSQQSDDPRVLLWLDPDDAGRKARARIRSQLTQLGLSVHIIRSASDPKFYPNQQIEEFIQSA